MDRLAYLFEEAELDGMVADWPPGMRLALCLEKGGAMQIVLYRSDEVDRVAERIATATGWSAGSFAAVPQLGDLPRMRILYSEAQWFLHVVAATDGLGDMARAYLDPPKPPQPALPRTVPLARAPIASSGLVPRRVLGQRRAGEALPDGYRPAREMTGRKAEFVAGRLSTSGARIRLTIEPDAADERTLPVRARPNGYRDDLRAFVLDVAALDGWVPGTAAMIDMPMEDFPKPLADRFARRSHVAEVTVTSDGIFVQPGAPELAGTPGSEPARPPRTGRRGWSLRAAALAVVGLAVVSGTVVTALTLREDPLAARLAYSPADGNTALNVLEAFALSSNADGDGP
ncbi:hypothetical protein [Roseivivax isoporae]|uniref:Uncharacterized protein n=1 Tax=Roseivivax isoporae LMG 25204 TaxID=1449351 RepID=X7F9T4_9RHOB|nr:hypothetical protein [Roseivivax isoporae]ETX28876.1 hypothetical protein RISW2_03975 [Roseivivax isoporae LMG 25204]